MSGFANPIVGAGGSLVYPSIHSPNFVSGSAGWSIDKNGDAQLNAVTLLGILSSIGPLGAAFAQVLIENGQIFFNQSSSESGPFFTDGQIGLQHLTGAHTGSTFFGATGVFGLSSEPGSSGGIYFVPPSGDATGATDTANILGLLDAGCTPWLLPGTFYVECGNAILTALGPGQWIICSGDLNTIIFAVGHGNLFRWVATGAISDGTTTGGGLIGGCTIDGSNITLASTAVMAGDINALRFDFRAQHFNLTGGSWGFQANNANNFTERMHLNIRTKDCGFAGGDGGHVRFTVTSPAGLDTSTGSFARLRGRIECTAGSNQQDFLVLNNGAHIYDHELELIGNHQGNALNATTAAVIRIIGTVPAGHPGAGTSSAISNGRLDIGAECSSAANAPTTIVQGSSSNSITSCYGNVNFNQNFTSSGIGGAGWKYDGQVQGDTALGTRRYYGTSAVQTITANGQAINSIVPSAKIPLAAAAGFLGMTLTNGDQDGQVIWLVNTSAFSQQFATPNVTIAAGAAAQCIWDAATADWYVV